MKLLKWLTVCIMTVQTSDTSRETGGVGKDEKSPGAKWMNKETHEIPYK